MFGKIWDIFVGWIYTPQGAASFAVCWAFIIAFLTFLTEKLDHYSPLSYGIAFIVTFFIIVGIVGFFKSIFGPKIFKKATFLEFDYDGTALHPENRENVWGWRWLGHEPQATGGAISLIIACFDQPISPDRISATITDTNGTRRVNLTAVTYESRYAVIQIILNGLGRYKVEFKYHGQP